jgi:hypothetical protein
LEIAAKYEAHIDTVLGFRQKYLDLYDKAEKNKLFLKYRKEVCYCLQTGSSLLAQRMSHLFQGRRRLGQNNAKR